MRNAEQMRTLVIDEFIYPPVFLAFVLALSGGTLLAFGPWFAAAILLPWLAFPVCVKAANSTADESSARLGLLVFAWAALFGFAVSAAYIHEKPKLSPVALITEGTDRAQGLTGLLVSRDGNDYWLATVTICDDKSIARPERGRIFKVSKDDLIDEEIGARTSISEAGERADQLLDELVKRQPGGKQGKTDPGSKVDPKKTNVAAVPAVTHVWCESSP